MPSSKKKFRMAGVPATHAAIGAMGAWKKMNMLVVVEQETPTGRKRNVRHRIRCLKRKANWTAYTRRLRKCSK